jgi:pimeloyl-ACP methyl ester carboxylesterase
VEIHLGRFPAESELPEPVKFAWPIIVLPEMFTTAPHLATIVGYFASTGWEVFAPDLHAVIGHGGTAPLEKIDFAKLTDFAAEAVGALGREAIVVGHGIGGLVALKLAEHSAVKAAVAIAPLAPGFHTPLFMNISNRIRIWRGLPLDPPTRRRLFEFVADADAHSRPRIIKLLTAGATTAALDVVEDKIGFATAEKSKPRLIVAGESDISRPTQSSRRSQIASERPSSRFPAAVIG